MPIDIGILLDVSRSMKKSYRDIPGTVGEPWAKSIFQIIMDLITYDLLSENRVFALAFGGTGKNVVFDILRTLEKFKSVGNGDEFGLPAKEENIEEFLSFLEKHGVRSIRRWVEVEVIRKVVDDYTLKLALSELKSNETFRRNFINDMLPEGAKEWILELNRQEQRANICCCIARITHNIVAAVAANFRKATKEEIKKIVEDARPKLLEHATSRSILPVHDALQIINNGIEIKDLTSERTNALYSAVKQFVFGNTPLCRALKRSAKLFKSEEQSQGLRNLLFVLSDGKPTDEKRFDVDAIKRDLVKQNVTVVSCYISRETIESKTLYSTINPEWSDGAKFLFDLCSIVPTQRIPLAILVRRGWQIDIKNNETKLFMKVNHPENVREACDLAQSVVFNQDALSDLLASVSLDLYINQNNDGLTASKQEGATCYANACATVLHLSMKRILGRENGYPDFNELRQELIERYGQSGAIPIKVLEDICPKYRLNCRNVDEEGAKKAITEKRPVVAVYRLTKKQRNKFDRFYARNPTGVLTKRNIDITKRKSGQRLLGHAVVLTSFNSQGLRLMNSWGESWGDVGFFRVQSADVLGLKFIDVYWNSDDLSENEKAYYKEHGAEVANRLMEKYIGLRNQNYECPLCERESPVNSFEGTMHRAKCPKCKRKFSNNNAGNLLALNMYLTSLAR